MQLPIQTPSLVTHARDNIIMLSNVCAIVSPKDNIHAKGRWSDGEGGARCSIKLRNECMILFLIEGNKNSSGRKA
jgi:hypothetical protein